MESRVERLRISGERLGNYFEMCDLPVQSTNNAPATAIVLEKHLFVHFTSK
jgi:hypothetical protein